MASHKNEDLSHAVADGVYLDHALNGLPLPERPCVYGESGTLLDAIGHSPLTDSCFSPAEMEELLEELADSNLDLLRTFIRSYFYLIACELYEKFSVLTGKLHIFVQTLK